MTGMKFYSQLHINYQLEYLNFARDILAKGIFLTRAVSSEGLFLLPISENFHFPPDLSCTDNLRKREALGNGGFGRRVRGGLVLLRNRKCMRARLRLYDRNELLHDNFTLIIIN